MADEPVVPKSVQNVAQWDVRFRIHVTIVEAGDDSMYGSRPSETEWTAHVPLGAINAVDYSALVKSMTAQALEKIRVQLIEEAAARRATALAESESSG